MLADSRPMAESTPTSTPTSVPTSSSTQSLSQRMEALPHWNRARFQFSAWTSTSLPRTAGKTQLPEDSAPGDVQVVTSNPGGAGDEGLLKLSDELITRAQQTAARVRFIEDASLLADVGGVGALLRFRI